MELESKLCFVISPIGEAGSETRTRSDQVLKHIVRPAVEGCGYKAVRADEIDKPGMITSQVIQHVVSDPLVVADLTGTNPNVFYELAVRHAIRKPFIQLIQKSEQIPFDVAGARTIYFDHKDLDSVAAAKDSIKEQIRELEANPQDVETPISISLDLQLLRQSENPEERSLADLVAAVSDLRSGVNQLGDKLIPGKTEQQFQQLKELIEQTKYLVGRGRVRMGKATRFSEMIEIIMRENWKRHHPRHAILALTALMKDFFPPLYEIGMEIYNSVVQEDWNRATRCLHDLSGLCEIMSSLPLFEYSTESNPSIEILGMEVTQTLGGLVERARDLSDSTSTRMATRRGLGGGNVSK